MFHDFDDMHGGKGNACDQGHHIMSYANFTGQTKFSSCSKKDWQAQYLYIKLKGGAPGTESSYGSECVTRQCSYCDQNWVMVFEFACSALQSCDACFNFKWCMEGNNVV